MMCPECGLPMKHGKCPQCDNYTPPRGDHRLALIALALLAVLLIAWMVF
jgi:hypothetical protein